MRRIGSALLAFSLLAGCGGTEAEPSSESLERQQAPLTTTDVDVAPECQGILTFVNTATFAKLDEFLPSDVATNLVNRRATSQFVSIADLLTVPLVGPARLEQIEGGARTQGLIGASCVGIEKELALSTDDAARMVSLVNSLSSTQLHDILPYAWNGAVNLLNARPFTSVQGIVNTSGIGPVSLRNIRNAATLSVPLETFVAAVNSGVGGHGGFAMGLYFDRWALMTGQGHYLHQLECFGFDDEDLPWGMTGDPTPVSASVVRSIIQSAGGYSIPQNVRDAALASFDMLSSGHPFKGCHVGYMPDPWSSHSTTFYVDIETGFSLMTDSYWTE